MNFALHLATVFFKGADNEPPLPKANRSYDLGVQAAEIHTYMNLNLPKSVYAHRIREAEKMLAEMMAAGSFNQARFEAGYESLMDQPYSWSRDVLSLKQAYPELPEGPAGAGEPAPAL